MATTYPGTTIEVLSIKKGSSRTLFEGIFATGGITLSQVSNMTGLEPYLIQNWVKRKFVASSVKKLYSKQQFARIIIINMLREALQIESICNLIHAIGGELEDVTDDLISDDELYHRYVDMISGGNIDFTDRSSVYAAAQKAAEDFEGNTPGDKLKLIRILEVMLYAHSSAQLRDSAKEILSSLQ
ncbi:MAG: DUF1836 domain-containing protein [Ruminococcaceae bacterium]|nr:DUF1836 domain-containing protein [Oscillospiraceae bacterium]